MNENTASVTSGLVSYDKWLREIGKTAATGWRWRRRGWITVQNIAGRLYISRAAIAQFEADAANGRFAQRHITPARKERDRS